MSIREDLKAFVDGELSPARAEEVRLAVAQDPALQQEVQFMKLLSENIREEAAEPEVVGVDKVLEAVRNPKTRLWSWLARNRRIALGLGVVCIFALGVILWPTFSQAKLANKLVAVDLPADEATEQARVDTIKGGRKVVPIPAKRAPAGAPSRSDSYTWVLGGGEDSPKVAPVPQAIGGMHQYTPTFNIESSPVGAAKTDPTIESSRKHGLASSEGHPLNATGIAPTSPATKFAAPPSNRKIIQNGDVEVEVADVSAAQTGATQIATSLGGFEENSSLNYSEDSIPHASLTIRVPAHLFGQALQRIEALGKVKSNNVTGQDVTAQYADTDARLKELNAEAADYVTMLRGARTIGQILEIKDRLSQVRQEIGSLQEQLSSLKDQSALSTLNVQFDQKPKIGPKVPQKKDPSEDTWAEDTYAGAVNGLTSAFHFLGRGVIFLFVYAPIWLPIAALVWFFNRRKKRAG